MNLTHDDLIQLGKLLGYSEIEKGICYGFSAMWAQAVLFNDEKTFYDRLNLIASHKGFNVVNLAKDPNTMSEDALANLLNNKPTYAFHKDKIYYIENSTVSLEQTNEKANRIFIQLETDSPNEATKKQLIRFPLFTNDDQYKNDFQSLKDKIDAIKNRLMLEAKENVTHHELSEEERALLEVLSFYDGVSLHLNPDSHRDLINTSYVPTQQDIDKIYPLTRPTNNLQDIHISVALDKSKAFNKDSLKKYFDDLQEQLATTNEPTPIFLSSHDHTLGLKYYNDIDRWIFMDTNDLSMFTDNPNDCLPLDLDTEELVEEIFNSLTENSSEWVVFNTTILTGKIEEQFNEKLKLFNSRHPIDYASMNDDQKADLLYLACFNGQLEIVKELMNHNPDINRSISGQTSLYVACQNGHKEIVTQLLKQGANINLSVSTGDTPLSIACHCGQLEVVNELLKFKPDVNKAADDKINPLFIACKEGHLEVVEALLKHNPKPQISEEFYELKIACVRGHLEIVNKLLSDLAVNPNEQFIKAFNVVCEYGSYDIVKKLLDSNFPHLATADDEGVTPLHCACQGENLEIIELLLNHSDFNAVDPIGPEANTPLLTICSLPPNENTLKIIELLLAKGANLSCQNEAGKTALDIALLSRNTAGVKLLWQAAINKNLKIEDIVSITSPARALSLIKTIENFNDGNANPNITKRYREKLIAVKESDEESLKMDDSRLTRPF